MTIVEALDDIWWETQFQALASLRNTFLPPAILGLLKEESSLRLRLEDMLRKCRPVFQQDEADVFRHHPELREWHDLPGDSPEAAFAAAAFANVDDDTR